MQKRKIPGALVLTAPAVFSGADFAQDNRLNLDQLDRIMRQGTPERMKCPKHECIRVGEKAGRDLPVGSDSLVDMRYWELAAKAVTESGESSCENWHPTWDAAAALFSRDYAGLDRDGLREAQNAAMKRKASMLVEARRLCREQGVY